MKPFNLKAALAGAKVVTSDGRDVKIAGYNEEINSLVGWIGKGVYQWIGDGKSGWIDTDLFMAPTERKEWIVRIGYSEGGCSTHGPYKSITEASNFMKIAEGETLSIHEITINE